MRVPAVTVTAIVLIGVYLLMLVELQLSLFNERALRARGAAEPADDVYRVMRLAYPGAFLAMGLEAVMHGTLNRDLVAVGLLLLGWAKALKFWAMATLRDRWTFRVLVVPGATLAESGPYRFVRHPNYIAVMGEIIAVAVALQAPVMGSVTGVIFAWILKRRIDVEDRALGRR